MGGDRERVRAAAGVTNPYEQLLDLTRRQRAMLDDGDWAGASALGADWQALVEHLPEQPPADARALLAEAASLAWSNTASLEALLAGVARELEHIGRGRRAVASYADAMGTSLDAAA
jgi:hypothetical protein